MIRLGSSTNRPMLIAMAITIATAMTTLSTFLPSFSASHFSNLLGSSWASSLPDIFMLSSSTRMPMPSIWTMFTEPRMKGLPIQGCFLLRASYFSRFTTISPLGRRTATAMASGLFIITPSSTAWPPMSARGQAVPLSVFLLIVIFL